MLWGNSLVLLVKWSSSVFSGLEEISGGLNHLVIGGFRVRFRLGLLEVLGVSWVGNGNGGDFFDGHGTNEGGNSKGIFHFYYINYFIK
jgi:hypothetical protein